MEEIKLRQLFKNLSDCYADTHVFSEEGFIEGEVIQAMTEDRFIETLREAKLLAAPAVSGRSEQLEAFLSEYLDAVAEGAEGQYYLVKKAKELKASNCR